MITYNEIDPFAAQWLRNLIGARQLPEGVVDERSIRDLRFLDVNGSLQFHAFAGIGVWAYVLESAGWPKEIPVWTGSCPCQPFSSAGKKKGFDDDRHLWPEWFRLIRACRPPIIFGEQVASPNGLKWFDAVSSDLEGAGYTVGAADLCAAGVGAPHLRQRLYFVAVADMQRCEGIGVQLRERRSRSTVPETSGGGSPSLVPDNASSGRREGRQACRQERAGSTDASLVVDANGLGTTRREVGSGTPQTEGSRGDESDADSAFVSGATRGYWADAEWIYCRDDKYRPVEPAFKSMVDGLPEGLGEISAAIADSFAKEVIHYAKNAQVDPREALHDVQKALAAETIQRPPTRFHGVHEAPFLLSFLRQLKIQGREVAECVSRSSAEVLQEAVRGMRFQEAPLRPPCERGLDRQPDHKSADAVSGLSSILASHAQAAWQAAFDTHAAITHPLANGATGRVGKLRAYGNALVAPVAQTFVESVMDVLFGLRE